MSQGQAKPTIIVVDDEPEMLRSLHDLLRLEYRVLTFESGFEALRCLAARDDVHVILSDQRMPEMTGVELLIQAKKVRPEVTRLLFTGYADLKAVIDAINEGNVFRYISKPCNPDEMLALIGQAVRQRDLIVEKHALLRDLKETNARLLEASRLKGAFLEVASHELNTPVAVVLGLTELWKMTQADDASPSERSWVEKIHGAGKRLATVVERMFKLIRSDRPIQTIERTEVALEAMLRDVVADLGPFLAARSQVVHLRLAHDLGSIEADPFKLADILTNLLANAIKFTPDGGSIILSATPEPPDRVRFEVIDEGKGIRAEDRPHLFEPFFTGYDTMNHSSGDYQYGKRGMGLGLCLVKTFVELHGGQVDCSCNGDGHGSTFCFTLPRKAPPPATAMAPHAAIAPPLLELRATSR